MRNYTSILALSATLAGAVPANRFLSQSLGLAGAGVHAYGVTRSSGVSGDVVPVDTLGTAVIETGGAIAAGSLVESDAYGRAVLRNTGVALGRLAPGEVATDAGQFVEVILMQTVAPLTGSVVLQLKAADLVGANAAVYRVVSPFAGTITKIQSVISGALATGNATLTAAINATAITGGVITLTQSGSAAGDVDVATPTAANVVAVGDVIKLTVGGANTDTAATADVVVTLVI